MSKYCSHCGAEVNDEAVVCIKCGCSVGNQQKVSATDVNNDSVVEVAVQRIKTNAIIWLVIAGFQIVLGFFTVFTLIVGVLNLIYALQDLNFCKSFANKPVGLVARVEPLTMPIITLIYNLLIGGIIGVAGSIYYFIALRGYVLENKTAFLEVESRYV